MIKAFNIFERIVREISTLNLPSGGQETRDHPFDERNIHPDIREVSKVLFDDGHYAQATFEAFKLLEKKVRQLSRIQGESGFKLMMRAFHENKCIQLNAYKTESDKDEQRGYMHMFAGAIIAIRNPRAHDFTSDTIDECLDYLSIASALLRKLDDARQVQGS